MPDPFKFNLPIDSAITAEQLAKQLEIEIEDIPEGLLETLVKSVQTMENDQNAVRQIIDPFYDVAYNNRKTNNDKHLELIDFGKYIVRSGKQINLVEIDESPDFVIIYEGRRVGVELTKLFTSQPNQHLFGKLNSLLEETHKYIIQQQPDFNGHFNVALDSEKILIEQISFIEMSKLQLREIAKQLALFIIETVKGNAVAKPIFLNEISRFDKLTLNLSLYENLQRSLLEKPLLIERIAQKEKKLSDYKANRNLQNCWLILVYTFSNSSSTFIIDPIIIGKIATGFDKIILFESWQGMVTEID